MKKITIFTASMLDNNFLEDPCQKVCLDSWYKLKNHIISLGYDCEIKIYDFNDPEVIKYKQECSFYVNIARSTSRIANGFRMYILSKYPNHLWLDSDVWINDSVRFEDVETITSDWWYIYNGDNLETYKFMYDSYYKNAENLYIQKEARLDQLKNWMDMDIFKMYVHVAKNYDWLESSKSNLRIVHLAPLYNRLNSLHEFEITSYDDCHEIKIQTNANSGELYVQNQILTIPKNEELYNQLVQTINDNNLNLTINSINKNKLNSSKMYLEEFGIDVTDKCNLNCAGCNHFSPLTKEPFFYDLTTFESDIKRMSELFMVHLIKIIGGEPFLHPNLLQLIEIVLKYFPDTNVRIISNGLLKDKISELDSIIKLNNYPVTIQISDYPVVDNNNNKFSKKVNKDLFYFLNLNLKGDSDIVATRSSCCNIKCYNLYHGRLYICPLMRNIDKLNAIMIDKFDIKLSDMSIDIYSSTAQEILLFLLDYSKAIQVCRYCSPHPKKVNWRQSQRKADEWVGFSN